MDIWLSQGTYLVQLPRQQNKLQGDNVRTVEGKLFAPLCSQGHPVLHSQDSDANIYRAVNMTN